MRRKYLNKRTCFKFPSKYFFLLCEKKFKKSLKTKVAEFEKKLFSKCPSFPYIFLHIFRFIYSSVLFKSSGSVPYGIDYTVKFTVCQIFSCEKKGWFGRIVYNLRTFFPVLPQIFPQKLYILFTSKPIFIAFDVLIPWKFEIHQFKV